MAHHCILSGLIWPHGANSNRKLIEITLALEFLLSLAQLATTIQVSKVLFWLMEHFTGRPIVEKKVRRKKIIAFAVLPAFAKPRRIHHQEQMLVDLLWSFFLLLYFFKLHFCFQLSVQRFTFCICA